MAPSSNLSAAMYCAPLLVIPSILKVPGIPGVSSGRNVQIDYRWGAGDADRIRKFATELVALAPDVILSTGSPSAAAFQQATRTVPIVVGGGLISYGPDTVDQYRR